MPRPVYYLAVLAFLLISPLENTYAAFPVRAETSRVSELAVKPGDKAPVRKKYANDCESCAIISLICGITGLASLAAGLVLFVLFGLSAGISAGATLLVIGAIAGGVLGLAAIILGSAGKRSEYREEAITGIILGIIALLPILLLVG